jgi:hypothetical protein
MDTEVLESKERWLPELDDIDNKKFPEISS